MSTILTYRFIDYQVTLASGTDRPSQVDKREEVPNEHHVPADGEEMNLAEEALLRDPEFRKVIADLKLPDHATVVADAWIYG